MTIRKILLAVDFSQAARSAACHARLLAERFGAELKVVHVVSYPLALPGAPNLGVQLGEWFTARADQVIVGLKSFFEGELQAPKVEYVVLEGDPAKRIVEYAHSNGVDLIVIPARSQTPFRRFLLGSVAAKVLHDVDCPVWAGVQREELDLCESLDIKTVVCAVDMEPQDADLVRRGAEAAAAFAARFFIVHVIPGAKTANGEYSVADPTDPDVVRAREHLEALKRRYGIPADVIIAGGEIHKAVCSEAERLNADLLIIGRSPQSGIVGRLPTHAYAIVRDSHCPVVSV
jgi:nucleotide-binding universal stress UspA family protein